jgi:hypothetical protein
VGAQVEALWAADGNWYGAVVLHAAEPVTRYRGWMYTVAWDDGGAECKVQAGQVGLQSQDIVAPPSLPWRALMVAPGRPFRCRSSFADALFARVRGGLAIFRRRLRSQRDWDWCAKIDIRA